MRSNPRLATNEHGYYEIRYREGEDTRTKSLRTKDLAKAQEGLAHFLLDTQTLPAYTCAQAWAIRQNALSGIVDQERIHNCWKALLPFFGPRVISGLQPTDFAAYTAARVCDGCSASTARRELVELKATFNLMVATKRMKAEDLPTFEFPPAGAARPFFLTEDECTRVFLAAAQRRTQPGVLTRLELFLHVGLGTGQRRRAIETLLWSQVDFDHGMIHFAKPGERVTRKRKASVPISTTLRAVLAAEYARRESDWVLRMPGSIRTSFETLFKELGMTHVVPHTLRHSLISQLLIKGRPIFTVSQLIGVSVAQIEKTYGHLTTAHLRAALE